jgi:long-subunit acyl-CoA synthetase (AMP-forming)
VPDKEVLLNWAKSNNKAGASYPDLVADKDVQKMIFDDLIAVGKAAKLRGFELPKEVSPKP